MSQAARESAKQLVKLLEKLPEQRIKHLVSFKDSQLNRFKPVAGLESNTSADSNKPTLAEIKDIINRTSGPLGLKNDLLKKVQDALPQEQFTETQIQEQIKSLSSLMDDKYKKYYNVGDKLYKPAGNPVYYERLMNELEGKNKETLFSALRTVVFGK